MKLDTFDVIELKDATKAIVIEINNNKCKIKRADILEKVVLIDKNEIKKVIYKK